MASLQCCPKCPRKLDSSSGLYRHRGICIKYKQYTKAHQKLHQELEATDATATGAMVKRAQILHSPQREREAIQLPETGPIGGNVMTFPQMEPSSSHPLSPTWTPLRQPSPPPLPDCDVMAFPQTEPPPSHPPSPTPQNPSSPPLPPGPVSPRPALSQSGRPLRNRRLPARYQDVYPKPPHPAALMSSPATLMPSSSELETAVVQRVTLVVRNRFQTAPNTFSLWKEYLYRPTYDPDAFISPEDLHRPHTSAIVHHEEGAEEGTEEASLYSNRSSELLMNWQNSLSSMKSNEETTHLVHSVLLHPQFQLGNLVKFNATNENRKADIAEEKAPFLRSFCHASVDINVPSGSAHEASQTFSISGLHYRHITTLIKEAFESPISKNFHLLPFKLFRKFPDCEDSDHVYSEIYNSDVLLDEHDKVQRRAPTDNPTCKRKKVVAALMFWSDATHLTSFGTAKMWPIYLLFGNLSKYIRCQPNSGATKHLAYIPALPDSFQDQLKSFHHKWDTQQGKILTHCRQELMHAVWKFLLDEDFLHAYTYGIVVRSLDGIERRVYPCILTYSADYPEKYVSYFHFPLYCHSLPFSGCYLPLFAIRACVPVCIV